MGRWYGRLREEGGIENNSSGSYSMIFRWAGITIELWPKPCPFMGLKFSFFWGGGGSEDKIRAKKVVEFGTDQDASITSGAKVSRHNGQRVTLDDSISLL